MDNVSANIETYSDNVLRACFHYLGNMPDSEAAYEEVFLESYKLGILSSPSESDILPELLFITRRICLADTLKDDDEESFLTGYFGLSSNDAKYVMGNINPFKIHNSRYKNRKVLFC